MYSDSRKQISAVMRRKLVHAYMEYQHQKRQVEATSKQIPLSPICNTRGDPGVSYGFNFSNDRSTLQYAQQSSNDYYRGSSMFVEQNSFVTPCSNATEKNHFGDVASFPPEWNYIEKNNFEAVGSTRVGSCTSHYAQQSVNDYRRGSGLGTFHEVPSGGHSIFRKADYSWSAIDYHTRSSIPPPAKRMKVENDFQHDDWSLAAVIRPFMKQKMDKEVLSFKEVQTTAMTLDSKAENEGSKSPNGCFRETDKEVGISPQTNSDDNKIMDNMVEQHSENVKAQESPIEEDSKSPNGCFRETDKEVGISLQTNSDDNKIMDNMVEQHSENVKAQESPIEKDSKSPNGCFRETDKEVGISLQTNSDDNKIMDNMLDKQSENVEAQESPIEEDSKSPNVCFKEKDKEVGISLQTNSDDNKIMDNMVDKQSENVEAQESPIEEDSKVSGVSLTDFFTTEEIESHLCSLNPSLNSKLGGKMSAPAVGENTCQLCVEDNLPFAAPAISCTSCGGLIIHKSTYYWSQDGMGKRYCFCTKCFSGSCHGTISFSGGSVSKATLNKDKNTGDSYEDWVQCDKCEQWQHQICALYNSEQDVKGNVKYTCPFCRLKEREANANVPIHRLASGARDLPRTRLSNHIEERLFRSLEQEKKQRAEILGKHPEEVPGASDLSVRVVLAAHKQLKVKQQYLDIFPNETYPTEFPYKSKVILLFQKIDGADVCLFAMYVKEFGSECAFPNKGCLYISYLDSVKHIRPDDIKTSTGVALRTFVYHELLIGYLDYCKKQGFATCYIWACPSSKGDDYILNCHPENQRRPNSIKLVQWYKKMIKKAKDENIVVDSTNFYDKFFVSSGESNSLARLPYIDGDSYWSRAIEEIIHTMNNEAKTEGHLKRQPTKRAFQTMGHSDLPVDTSKDIIMHKLGEKILNVKKEIMVIELQFNCTNCNEAILSGGYWSCNQCSKFHLCARCLEFEQISNGMKTHTDIHGEKHSLSQIPLKTTTDMDDNEIQNRVLDNNIFEDRVSFLDFCEKKHYQFDTLRRAKHSSMMILHYLRTKNSTNQVKVLMELLAHANECRPTEDNPCSKATCRQIKGLFLHSRNCKVRRAGGCVDCKKVWNMLYLHSKYCTDSYCKVPRCRDIKNYKKTKRF